MHEIVVSDGNSLAREAEDLAYIPETYDVLVVVTSSFGDGEPPDNFGQFVLKLMVVAERGGKPLRGLQHAVLGEGNSKYRNTFQNCPRLTDKYLEACGSRRFVPRHETDVSKEEKELSRSEFRQAVCLSLSEGLPTADTPPAAEWSKPRAFHTEPTAQISPKTASQLAGNNGSASDMFSAHNLVGPVVLATFAICAGSWELYCHQYPNGSGCHG